MTNDRYRDAPLVLSVTPVAPSDRRRENRPNRKGKQGCFT